MELDLSGVASFLVLGEEVHFGRAAARLHLTQSALSKNVF
jgi:DNA-binding transcriptional LysR family regulator